MKFVNLLDVVDYEQNLKVIIEGNGIIEARVRGDQASILKMLSKETLEKPVTCIAPREEKVLYIWLEDAKDEKA